MVRKWKVFIAPSCHVDIGYNFLQDQALENHEKNVSRAIKVCKTDLNFRWNLECAWIAQKYLEDHPAQREDLINLARDDKIGIQSGYLNMLTGVMSQEEINRLCYFAGFLKREYGIPMQSAMLTDVPSAIWSLPTALALSGVKYFAHGVNPLYGRGPFYPRTNTKPLFWWQGLNGSRVLTWLASGYGQVNEVLGIENGCEHLEKTLSRFLSEYERSDYPFDAVLVYGANYENKVVDHSFRKVVEEWNSKHEYPHLILSTPDEFFRYIEENFKDEIPTQIGDEGCWWEDGVASSARETLLIRHVHEKIITVEKIWSLLSLNGIQYPSEIKDIWEKIFLYDEHTWGADKSIADPELKFVKDQWKIKSSFAYNAAEQSDSLIRKGFEILSSQVESGEKPTILVFNQLSWVRTDVVEVKLEKRTFDLIDADTNQLVPYQWIDMNKICFLANDVPPMGYKRYELCYGKKPTSDRSVKFFPNGIENKFYRIKFDSKGIVSLYDKELEYEFVDEQSSYKLNQYIYASGGSGTSAIECNEALSKLSEMDPELSKRLMDMISLPNLDKLSLPDFTFVSPTSSRIEQGSNGPVFGEILLKTACEKTPRIVQRIILYKEIKRIDLINEFDKEETYEKEAVYFAFPFRLKNPEFKIEIPNGTMRPEKDQLKGACRDWYCAQHYVNISDGDHTVIWSSPDVPLVSIQNINTGKWLEKLEIRNGSLFSYVMNNYWYTNYKASQKGCRVRYSITTQGKAIDNFDAIHFSWGYANPLLAVPLKTATVDRKKKWELNDRSFLSVDKPNIVVTAMKLSEDEKGLIVRLFETEGKTGEVILQLPFRFKSAYLCSLIEEKIKPLPIKEGKVNVHFRKHDIVTIKLYPNQPKY